MHEIEIEVVTNVRPKLIVVDQIGAVSGAEGEQISGDLSVKLHAQNVENVARVDVERVQAVAHLETLVLVDEEVGEVQIFGQRLVRVPGELLIIFIEINNFLENIFLIDPVRHFVQIVTCHCRILVDVHLVIDAENQNRKMLVRLQIAEIGHEFWREQENIFLSFGKDLEKKVAF